MKITLNIKGKLKEVTEKVNRAIAQEAQAHRSLIVSNAVRGLDFSGKRMREYSPGYKRQRENEGRRVSPPDMTRTGHMLQSIQLKTELVARGATVTIFFIGGVNIKSGQSAPVKARNVTRLGFKFFGISEEQKKKQIENIKNKVGIR